MDMPDRRNRRERRSVARSQSCAGRVIDSSLCCGLTPGRPAGREAPAAAPVPVVACKLRATVALALTGYLEHSGK